MVVHVPGPWKILSKLVETTGKNAICRVESLLDTIPVVAVDINVENARICTKEFQDRQNDVIDIAET